MAAPGGPAQLQKKKQKHRGLEPQGGHPTDGMEGWGSSPSRRSPTARRPLTISESPMRERSAGTAMAVVGTRSGEGRFVKKRTRTWRDGSASMAAAVAGVAAEKVFACSNGAGFNRFRVGALRQRRPLDVHRTDLSVRWELVRTFWVCKTLSSRASFSRSQASPRSLSRCCCGLSSRGSRHRLNYFLRRRHQGSSI
jgi:hypothetical protein